MLPETVTLTIEEYLDLKSKSEDKLKQIEVLIKAASIPFIKSSATYPISNGNYEHHVAGQVRAWSTFKVKILDMIKEIQTT